MGATEFKIYSLLLVKDEADVITASLSDACRWSDKIIVIDNGSTDGTWEKVQALALTHPQVVPWLRYDGPFHIGLRARAFRAFRHELTCRDWWCVRLDADEFFTGDVRAFLASVPLACQTVKKSSRDYVLTFEDLQEHNFSGSFEADRPFIRSFLPLRRQERRFMRHSPLLVWKETWRYPHPWGRVYAKPVEVEHFQYRSPQQMERRFLTRQKAKSDGCGSFKHEQGASWRDYLVSRAELQQKHTIAHLPEAFAGSENIMHKGRNTVKLLEGGLVVKRFARPSLINSLIYGLFRKSKAERSFIYARRLGAASPEPVAWLDIKRGGLLTDSYYVSRLSSLPYTAMQLAKDPAFPDRDRHLRAIARFTVRLHEQGIMHRDYSGGNILFDDDDNIQIVDLNRLVFNVRVSLERGCRNFERLDLDPAACTLLGEEYARARGFDPQLCAALVRRFRWTPWHVRRRNFLCALGCLCRRSADGQPTADREKTERRPGDDRHWTMSEI